MSKAPGWFASMLSQKCPHCRSEKVFLHPSYSFSFLQMHEKCPHCQMNFEPEPGFYWGAMYITYAFNAGLAITASLVMFLFFGNPDIWVYVGVIAGLSLVLAPVFFRYSRMILLYGLGGKKFDATLYKKA
ncbi:DUF983 domain-containing protein [bacterium]|nr:DUF983 domain-containing protein [bacterium]